MKSEKSIMLMTENGNQLTENGNQLTEDGNQLAEDGKQNTESCLPLSSLR